jgi:hypothetical protein
MQDVLESPSPPRWRRGLFWREGGDDLLEARIAAERVPKGEQLKHAVARG